MFNLLGFGRTLILEEIRVGIEPFMPSGFIPWVAAGLIILSLLGLWLLSKVTLTSRMSMAIIFCTGLIVVAFHAFLVVELFTARRCTWRELILPEGVTATQP